MFKKISLIATMLVFVGLGATQLFARQLIAGQSCCPDTLQGSNFAFAVLLNNGQVECSYLDNNYQITRTYCYDYSGGGGGF